MKVGLRFNLVSGDVLPAGMGFASLWRHGRRSSTARMAVGEGLIIEGEVLAQEPRAERAKRG